MSNLLDILKENSYLSNHDSITQEFADNFDKGLKDLESLFNSTYKETLNSQKFAEEFYDKFEELVLPLGFDKGNPYQVESLLIDLYQNGYSYVATYIGTSGCRAFYEPELFEHLFGLMYEKLENGED